MDPKINSRISQPIEHKPLTHVSGIIVHQTGGSSAAGTLASYQKTGADGAHFLIDKDGTIYQTASVYKQTWHVGKLRSRCLAEHTCSPVELKLLQHERPQTRNAREMTKDVPARYPANTDSLGIELVGKTNPVPGSKTGEVEYEAVTDQQNASLKWLVNKLATTFGVPMTEVFRHPTVSQKTPSEASTAKW